MIKYSGIGMWLAIKYNHIKRFFLVEMVIKNNQSRLSYLPLRPQNNQTPGIPIFDNKP